MLSKVYVYDVKRQRKKDKEEDVDALKKEIKRLKKEMEGMKFEKGNRAFSPTPWFISIRDQLNHKIYQFSETYFYH